MTRTTLSLLLGFALGALGCSTPADDVGTSSGGTTGVAGAGGAAGAVSAGGSGGLVGSGGAAGGASGATSGGTAGSGGSGGTSGGTSGTGEALPRFIGRWNDTHSSAWSGSAIEVRFNGTDLSVTMSGANTWYEVVVDGGTPTKIQIGATSPLATGLAAGDHVVQMVRRAEAFNGTSQFVSFSVPDTSILPQQVPTRRIEVIGDSYAVAYGIDGCGDRTNADENAYLAWGWVLARAVNADVHIIAQSGIGMAYSLGLGDTMPDLYNRALGVQSAETWDFSKYQPDAVIIDLGSNDGNAKDSNDQPVFDAATFKTAYTNFLTTVRTNYPNALIYCGSHYNNLATEITEVVTGKADAKIKFLAFADGTNTACDYHLDPAGHEAFANTAKAALSADLGW